MTALRAEHQVVQSKPADVEGSSTPSASDPATAGAAWETMTDGVLDRQTQEVFAALRRDLFGNPLAELSVVVPLSVAASSVRTTVEGFASSPLHRPGVTFVLVEMTSNPAAAASAVSAIRSCGLRARVVSAPRGSGVGAAMQLGVAECRAAYVAVISDPSAIDLGQVSRSFARMRLSCADVVVSERRNDSAESSPWQRLVGRIGGAASSNAVERVVSDPRAGVMLMRGDLALRTFASLSTTGELFNVEILGKAHADGHSIEQIGLVSGPNGCTTLRDALRTVRGARAVRRCVVKYAAAPLEADARSGQFRRVVSD